MHCTFTQACLDFLIWATVLILQSLYDDSSRACLMTFDLKTPPLNTGQLTRAPWRPVCQVTVTCSGNVITSYIIKPFDIRKVYE